MIPEAAAPGWRAGNLVNVVNQDIYFSGISLDHLKESFDFVVVGMIDLHSNTLATGFFDGSNATR
jgi:hypothetical protein